MKRLLLITLLALPVHAAPQWLKRAAATGACAASMLDLASTVSSVNRSGHETNPLLAGPNGPRYGRIVGLKIGLCAAQVIAAEISRNPAMDWAMIGVAAAEIGAFGFAAHHNTGVAR
jgi:hypothetical protein